MAPICGLQEGPPPMQKRPTPAERYSCMPRGDGRAATPPPAGSSSVATKMAPAEATFEKVADASHRTGPRLYEMVAQRDLLKEPSRPSPTQALRTPRSRAVVGPAHSRLEIVCSAQHGAASAGKAKSPVPRDWPHLDLHVALLQYGNDRRPVVRGGILDRRWYVAPH